MKAELLNEITEKMITLMNEVTKGENVNLWDKLPFSVPKNGFRNYNYTGLNWLHLNLVSMFCEYDQNLWFTFHEIKEMKANLKKGSKGVQVFYYKKIQEVINGVEETKSIIKYYYVFNISDVENLPEKFKPAEFLGNNWEKFEKAEEIITNSKIKIDYKAQNNAYYSPTLDKITLPERSQFKGSEEFYNVAFHELTHATGAPHRLNRFSLNIPKKEEYAFEELVAELGAVFMAQSLGFEKLLKPSAFYLKSWLKALKNDTSFIFKASLQASKAYNYITNNVMNSQYI